MTNEELARKMEAMYGTARSCVICGAPSIGISRQGAEVCDAHRAAPHFYSRRPVHLCTDEDGEGPPNWEASS
jgi:hypothetical protein